jgi:hypothetical protein
MSRKHEIHAKAQGNSTLTHNFNTLWCEALNMRESHGVTHFAMCHADVKPEPWWVDLLLAEMNVVQADILSVVLPIKDARGLTSTGVGPIGKPGVKRFTMREIQDFPVTFSIDSLPASLGYYLAVNTGLWIAQIANPWADEFPGFKVENAITKGPDGKFYATFRPEDWLMSDWAHKQGLQVFATTAIRASHAGYTEYENAGAWGEWDTDLEHPGGDT